MTTKYVKLVVKSQVDNKAFYNLREIEFLQTLNLETYYNAFSSANGLLNYDSKWTNEIGNYVNNMAKHTKDGKVKFYINGSDFMLYSKNAESKITIDGVTYTIKENHSDYAPSFIIDSLSKGIHEIEIDAKDMSIDMIKTSGYLCKADGSGGAPAERPSENPSEKPKDEPKEESKDSGCFGASSLGFVGLVVLGASAVVIMNKISRKKSSKTDNN